MEIKVIDYFQYNAYVTLSYFFICFVTLVLDKITVGKANKYIFSTERASLLNPLTYIRFFTHIIGHSDWNHFSNNFLKILLLGPLIEEKYGSINLLLMILVTALITGIINFIKGNARIKGASGIAFMLIVLSSFVNVAEQKIPLTLILIILFYIIDEIIKIKNKDNIAHDAHIVGAICGVVFGFLFMNEEFLRIILNLENQIFMFFT